jgi:hypothetical protein
VQDVDRSITAGKTAETSGIANCSNQLGFRDPGHGTAQNRIFDVEEFAAPFQERGEHVKIVHKKDFLINLFP